MKKYCKTVNIPQCYGKVSQHVGNFTIVHGKVLQNADSSRLFMEIYYWEIITPLHFYRKTLKNGDHATLLWHITENGDNSIRQ